MGAFQQGIKIKIVSTFKTEAKFDSVTAKILITNIYFQSIPNYFIILYLILKYNNNKNSLKSTFSENKQ